MSTDPDTLATLLHDQSGCIARRQVLAAGFNDAFIAGRMRRREWAGVHPGVYVDHTGPLTWTQRAWAAVLCYWPAALCHESVVRGDRAALVHVAIAQSRTAVRRPGVRLHRVVDLEPRVSWHLGPPRVRVEHAVLDMCTDLRERTDALAVVTDVCGQRRTTVSRLLQAMSERTRVRHGAWLRRVLADVDSGVMSVLEHTYLNRVERAHGLPTGRRQRTARTEDGVAYRDVEYPGQSLLVELDGRLGHERGATAGTTRIETCSLPGRGSRPSGSAGGSWTAPHAAPPVVWASCSGPAAGQASPHHARRAVPSLAASGGIAATRCSRFHR